MTFDEWFVEWKDTLPFAPDEKHIRRLCDQCWQAAQKEAAKWRPIETAPRGSGEDGPRNTRDPAYVSPPKLLLWTEEGPVVGYYDWYYHPGYGSGAEPGVSAWRDRDGSQTYGASHWMPLPAPPSGANSD